LSVELYTKSHDKKQLIYNDWQTVLNHIKDKKLETNEGTIGVKCKSYKEVANFYISCFHESIYKEYILSNIKLFKVKVNKDWIPTKKNSISNYLEIDFEISAKEYLNNNRVVLKDGLS